MIGAALYLSRRSFANSIQRRLQRLRQPKYLVGFFVGLLYFYWIFFRPGGGGRDRTAESILPTNPLAGETIAVAGLVVIVLFTWVLGSAETPFTFQLAETDFLFTAPLTRRQVLQFRLVRSQLALLVSAVFSVVLFSRGHIHASLLLRVVALWLLYSTLQLHNAGAALVRASLTQQGVIGIRRKLLSLVVVVFLLGAFWLGLRDAVPVVREAWSQGFMEGATALSGALHRGALAIALLPFFAATGPLVATSAAEFAERLPAALAVATLLYLWVMRSTLGFEEAAVEHANRVARRIEAVRRGRGEVRPRPGGVARPLLRLSATGTPAGAIMWKNVTGAMREFRPRTLFLLAVFVVVLGFSLGGKRGAGPLVGTLSLALTGIMVLFGPLALRYDLRRDLELLDVLKSWPVRARDLIAAEVLAPALLIAGVAWFGLLGAFFATLPDRTLPPLALRVPVLFAALAAVPAVVLVLLLVQNAAVLLFPAWTTIGPERATGFEAMGQRILVFVGTALALVIAVLPAAIVGGVFALLVHSAGAGMGWTAAVWSVTGSAVLVFECYLGTMLLGPVLERLEPSGLR